MQTLVVYYSLSGTTRAVAVALAEELGAEVEEIRCDRYRATPWGAVRAVYDIWRGRNPPITEPQHAPSRYDLVVIGSPVWAHHVATPVRVFLRWCRIGGGPSRDGAIRRASAKGYDCRAREGCEDRDTSRGRVVVHHRTA
jgi:flavodoxin